MRHNHLRFGILILVLMSVCGGVGLWSLPSTPVLPPPSAVQVLHIPRPTVADIQKRGVLTVLMHHDASSYFLYRGGEHGFEYELAHEFAQQFGVTLQVRIPPPGVALTHWLVEGKGDIAAGVIVTDGGASAGVRYSEAYITVDIQGIPYTDQPYPHAALHIGSVSPDTSARPESARIGWAVRPEQVELLAAVNQYHAWAKQSGLRKILYEKYFASTHFLRSDETTIFANRLSRYDPLIARYAESVGFDWRLISALIFEESRFDHSRISPRGAQGLMQVMDIAAREVGIENFQTIRGNLEAGTKYLHFLLTQFPDGQTQDRLALALSGYLLGPSRVRAAQQLAHALGYDPYCWKDSVESVFPLLEDVEYYQQINASFIPGGEAVRYVNAILKRYELYTRYIPRDFPAAHTARPHRPLLSVSEPTG